MFLTPYKKCVVVLVQPASNHTEFEIAVSQPTLNIVDESQSPVEEGIKYYRPPTIKRTKRTKNANELQGKTIKGPCLSGQHDSQVLKGRAHKPCISAI